MRQIKNKSSVGAIAAVTPNAAPAPAVFPRAVTDPNVIDQGRLFKEATRQAQPIATAGSRESAQTAKVVGKATARNSGLRLGTCERMVSEGRELDSLVSGPTIKHRAGHAAEVVAAADYLDLHAGDDPGITNSPQRVADNVQDIRVSPDSISRKDLLFFFRTKDGMVPIVKPNGQVKTGKAQYVSDTLVKMAETPGYGKVGYVDARYVNSDGTPRVAPDGFTKGQARQLRKAKVRLRGIKDLDARAKQLVKNVDTYAEDGLSPVARKQLQQLRNDITQAYQPGKAATRMIGGAATGAATAAVLSLVLQLAIDGTIELDTVKDSAKKGALFGAGNVLADAGIYHAAIHLDKTPEVAKSLAQNSVAAGFCFVAVGVDVMSEIKSVRNGEVTTANAVTGTAAKVALDVLPLVVAPLGFAGIPVVIGAQVCGRRIINLVRESDKKFERSFQVLDEKGQRLDRCEQILERTSQILDRNDQRLDLRGHILEWTGENLAKQLHERINRVASYRALLDRFDVNDALFGEFLSCKRSARLRAIK